MDSSPASNKNPLSRYIKALFLGGMGSEGMEWSTRLDGMTQSLEVNLYLSWAGPMKKRGGGVSELLSGC